MREIKFRAWDINRRCFHWGISNLMLSLSGIKFWQFAYDAPEIVTQDDYILQQYTGLEDKNGKEIYEGDIVKHSHIIGSVHYQVESGRYNAGQWALGWLHDADKWEVIGNIYENPELVR